MTPSGKTLYRPTSVDEALSTLAGGQGDVTPLGGGTWVMRAVQRQEPGSPSYVALDAIDELGAIELGDPTGIGARATHSDLGALPESNGPLRALREAARASAFPAVRNVATIAGNICARGFVEADLVPALVASDAEVEVRAQGAQDTRTVADVVTNGLRSHELLTYVRVPCPEGRWSAYERLSVRGAGEYPLCSVAVSLDVAEGRISAARVAVGSVAEVARRSPAAEEIFVGAAIGDLPARSAGEAAASELPLRDGLDAPGWYRLAVLPALLERASVRIAAQAG